ncbi:MAG TPA: MBL fold metallo-hydrolase [Nitrospirota bacterium]|nr:MBL fold metallo-hydrolase [Nitrospirota bacterium]
MSDSTAISPEELKKMLDTSSVEFLFDLRNADDFKSWHIEGKREFETLNLPQEDFIGEEDRHLGRFPKDKKILTICAHGDAAAYAADLLRSHGLRALSLKGGMDTWSEYYEVDKVSSDPAIYQVYRVAKGCISYLISSRGQAVVIDAPRHIGQIRTLAESLKVKITDVLDTHLHADHISGGHDLAEAVGALYHLNTADAGGAAISFQQLADGQKVTFGSCVLEVIHSPGHTPGSTSFLLNGTYLFTGDTIMKTSIGRPDLGGLADEWSALLHDTLFRRFARFSDDIVILPSHASSVREQDDERIIRTTMGEARRDRDLFQLKDRGAFARRIRESLLENPDRYQDIRKVNLGVMLPDEEKRKELEIGKNLCGMAKVQG